MSLRIRQIVFAARDLATTVREFERTLGLDVAYRDPQVAEFGLENALLPIGDQFLEVVAPTRENTAAGRHLERHGDSAYMLILQTDDLARDRARLDRLGVRIVWQSTYPDISAMHLHPKDVGGAIVSLDQPTPPESWRWAGPDWKHYVSKTGAQQVLEATVASRDPAALAHRWAEILGTAAPTPHASGFRIAIDGGALDFTPSNGQADRIIAYRIVTNALAGTATVCGTRLDLIQTPRH